MKKLIVLGIVAILLAGLTGTAMALQPDLSVSPPVDVPPAVPPGPPEGVPPAEPPGPPGGGHQPPKA